MKAFLLTWLHLPIAIRMKPLVRIAYNTWLRGGCQAQWDERIKKQRQDQSSIDCSGNKWGNKECPAPYLGMQMSRRPFFFHFDSNHLSWSSLAQLHVDWYQHQPLDLPGWERAVFREARNTTRVEYSGAVSSGLCVSPVSDLKWVYECFKWAAAKSCVCSYFVLFIYLSLSSSSITSTLYPPPAVCLVSSLGVSHAQMLTSSPAGLAISHRLAAR